MIEEQKCGALKDNSPLNAAIGRCHRLHERKLMAEIDVEMAMHQLGKAIKWACRDGESWTLHDLSKIAFRLGNACDDERRRLIEAGEHGEASAWTVLMGKLQGMSLVAQAT